jgi:hypothetical protein
MKLKISRMETSFFVVVVVVVVVVVHLFHRFCFWALHFTRV